MSNCAKHKPKMMVETCPQCLLAIVNENELLKSYIACEVDNMAAYAPFDELGNKMRYVQRAFFTVGHIIPELKELKKEVEITCQEAK